MGRIQIKGLLYKDLDEMYQDAITAAFKKSKLSKQEFTKKYEEKIDDCSEAFEESVIKTYADFKYTINFTDFHKSILGTQKAIAKAYKQSFTYYFSYLSTCHVILNNTLKQLDQFKLNQTDHVIVASYAHLLRKIDQIGIMLLNGYEDGALILWRAFYEFAIITILIAKKDSAKVSKKFMEHTIRHSKKLMESYQSRLLTEGFDPIGDEEQKHLNEVYQQLSNIYGKEFVEGDYSWATDVEEIKGRKTFRAIEEWVGMGRFRPFYIWASAYSHASFEVFKKSTIDNKIYADDIIDSRPVLNELLDPMQISISVMHEVNESILKLISHEDESYLNAKLLYRLYLKLLQTFDTEAGKDILAGQ